MLEAKLNEIQSHFLRQLEQAATDQELEAVRVAFLGRNGSIAELMEELKKMSLEEKKLWGPKLNAFKQDAQARWDQKKEALQNTKREYEQLKQQHFDVTAYKPHELRGSLHPMTQTIQQIEDIFISMGFQVADGPEVETDYYNFTALNIPEDHPARDMHDTFWLNIPGLLLRTHTSNVQVHVMESQKPPIAVIVPGRCYRHEATDASHDYLFMQTEGLVIDKHISMSHLLATAQVLLKAIFEKDVKIRVRPGYFPFVEPGIEIDVSCPFCTTGCSVCKKTTWIEVFPAGMVHPNVLRMSNIDPTVYSGFAFGFGLTRLAMLKHGINDIRLMHSGKLEFLSQF